MNERRLTVLRGRAGAKVTLSLRVLGTRPDGFHELDALTVLTAAPFDDVVISQQPRSMTTVVVTPRDSAPTKASDNLAARAVELLRPHMPATIHGVRIKLTKRIPMGAGLGGGSSDAATVLRLLQRHYRISGATIRRAAAKLGSDVPFCVRGAPAWLRGRGERLVAAPHVPPLHLVIATPPFGCATPAVYRAWDELGGPTSDRVVESDLLDGGLRNDLESAALVVAPALADWRDRMAALTRRSPLLLGSGSSYAVLVADADEAARHEAALREGLVSTRVWATTTAGANTPPRST